MKKIVLFIVLFASVQAYSQVSRLEATIIALKAESDAQSGKLLVVFVQDDYGNIYVKSKERVADKQAAFIGGFLNYDALDTVVVECSDGQVTTCSGGTMKLARCVGAAISDCLDGGGCASVCRAEALI